MKRLLHDLTVCAVSLMLAVPLVVSAHTYDEGGFRWEYDIYEDGDGAYVATINDVWQIDEKGDWKEWDATALTVPATLPTVTTNEYARAEPVFDEAGDFVSNKYVTVLGPEVKTVVATVTSLYAYQEDNEKLTSVAIPETVEWADGFGGCTSLATVTMGAETQFDHTSFCGTPWLKAQGEFVVRDDVLIAYQGSATSVTVPDGIRTIGEGAFSADCNAAMTNLTGVTLPASLEGIDDEAFSYCEKLNSITIPSSVTRIGYYAFEGCVSLTQVALPAKLKYLGSGAFSHCEGLTSIAIPELVKQVPFHAFYCCTGLTSVAFSSGLKEIGTEAFLGAGALTAVDIPASVKSIGDSAFEFCDKLATVTGCAGLEDVWYSSFDSTALYDNVKDGIIQVGPIVVGYNGTLPEVLTIPEGVTKIAVSAFSFNGDVKTLNLPSTLKEIESGAFYYSALETLNLPSAIKEIASNAFAHSGLKTVTGGDGLEKASDSSFSSTPYGGTFWDKRGDKDVPFELIRLGRVAVGYRGVCPAEIVIPDDVRVLASSLFDKDSDDTVSNITSVVVGSGVKDIRSWAFWGAENLKTAIVSGALVNLSGSAFGTCFSLTDVTLTGSTLSLYSTFYLCTNLVNVTINLVEPEKGEDDEDESGASLWIDTDQTFLGCDKLASVKVTRPGFKLTGWNTWDNLDEEIVFADEIDTFSLYKVERVGEYVYHNGIYIGPVWKRVLRTAETDAAFDMGTAATYLGWINDASGNVAGSVLLKVKKGKKGASTTTATATVDVIGGRKTKLKGSFDANGIGQGDFAGLMLTANGLYGTLMVAGATYTADGARDVSKEKNNSDQNVLKALEKKVWTAVFAPSGAVVPAFANGFVGFSVTMGTKGKAKISGILPDGARVNVSAKAIVGGVNCCIPVIYSKSKDSLGFLLWIDCAGNAVDVTGISEWKGKGTSAFSTEIDLVEFESLVPIKENTSFSIDKGDVPESIWGVLTDFLPIEEPVMITTSKWTVNKAASVKYKKGVFDSEAYEKGLARGKTNKAGLKLKYTQRTGSFSGSFTIFANQNGKLKKFKATVNGVVCDGVGYGSALIKNQGTLPVIVGELDED